MFTNKDLFEKGMAFQKDMIDAYQKNMKDFSENIPWGKAAGEVPSFMKDAPDFMKKYTEQMTEFYKMWMPFGTGVGKDMPDYGDFINKMFFGGTMYKSVYDLWNSMLSEFPVNEPEKLVKYIESMQELSMKTLSSVMEPMLPEQLRGVFGNMSVLSEKYMDSMTSFFKPWIESTAKLNDCTQKMMKGDPDAISEYSRIISDAYDKSYGRILNVAGIGYNREINEEFNKSIDAFIRFMMSYVELMNVFAQISRDAAREVIQKTSEKIKENDDPMAFKDFYSIWLRTNASAFEKIFKTEEFSKIFGDFSSRGYQFKINSDELMQRYLEFFPIPTDKEMKELYKTVYELRKENRDLKVQLKDINKQLEEIRNRMPAEK